MDGIKEFDLLNSPLEGTNLIEASAGTGKTYTIANLFLRLLLEKSLTIDQILVVTFTEAATGELKERIRTRIKQALETFSLGKSEDYFLNELVERQKSPALSLQTLREALRSFDQAAIFTIHGFCLRILQENAFESSVLFDTELITEQENIKREVVEDFWRNHLYRASPLFIHYTINHKLTPEKLINMLGNRIDRPYYKIIPKAEIPDSSSLEKEYQACFEEVNKAWNKAGAEVENILRSHEGLKKDYTKNITTWIQNMDQFLSSGSNKLSSYEAYNKFTSSELKRSVKKNYSPPEHPFFKLCDNLKEKQQALEKAFGQQVVGLKYKLFNYAKEELERRKEANNVQSFDDLLIKLRRALSGEGGEELAKAIRSKFKAALIDEFQDTDPIQYDIFKKVFSKGKSILFLIGDPKQAIYGFRGADVFAYLDAASQVNHRYTLKENWRSEPDLITAINTIFGNKDHPFVYKEIKFQPARPAEKQELEVLKLDESSRQPFQLWFLNAVKLTEPGKSIPKNQAQEMIFNAVAGEIVRLLNLSRKNRAFLGKRPLKERDIAVLVRKNAEARMIQKALSALNVHSVLYSTESLFETYEALEMERIIAAIVEPNNEVFIRAALSTEMIGVKGEELENLLKDDTGWDKWLIKFKEYHNLWNERGFIVMFRRLLAELTVLTRLMSLPGGERRATNVLHLTEVLHQVSIDKKLAMTSLLNWLSEQRASGRGRKEEYQLRLESDENAVNLVTIHKSKGLEYPVVFCPFTWGGSKLAKSTELVEFHSKENNRQLTLDLGSEEEERHRMLAEKEQLAENLRLFCVARSRAEDRC
ncbi:MAG: exodeoxyribonuclease V subunit beta, partial [Deltaproteobacteria bacterium]